MSDREKAVSILTKARDILIDRVCNFAIENEEELLAQAAGEGYLSIEELTDASEQLRQYSLILGVMEDAELDEVGNGNAVAIAMAYEPITFSLWANQIRAGDLSGASHSLSYLFQIDVSLAVECNRHFSRKLENDPQLWEKTCQLRDYILAGKLNGSTLLLQECFGLKGNDAIQVAQFLSATLA